MGYIILSCIESTAFNQDAFYQAAWNPCIHHTAWTPLHTIRIHCATMHGILAFIDAACNPMYSIGMLWAMLHKIHCIHSCCKKTTAFNKVPFLHDACYTLHSIMLHLIHCIQSGCILPRCMDYTAFNHAAGNPLYSIGMF